MMVLKSEFANGALLPQDVPEFWRNSNPCQLKAKDEVGSPFGPAASGLCRERTALERPARGFDNGFGAPVGA
jgi:hypothetical protein